MQDTELYRHVLGLEEPWKVERVKLDVTHERVESQEEERSPAYGRG